MIDQNVARGWNKLAKQYKSLNLPGITASSDPARLKLPRKGEYLDYWEIADQLVKAGADLTPTFTYRRLDELLFQLGRQRKAKSPRKVKSVPSRDSA